MNCARICRLCLKTSNTYLSIHHTDNTGIPTSSLVRTLVPELYLGLSLNPVVCSTCYNQLRQSYHFRSQCLRTENLIGIFLRETKCNASCISLEDVTYYWYQTYKKKPVDNKELLADWFERKVDNEPLFNFDVPLTSPPINRERENQEEPVVLNRAPMDVPLMLEVGDRPNAREEENKNNIDKQKGLNNEADKEEKDDVIEVTICKNPSQAVRNAQKKKGISELKLKIKVLSPESTNPDKEKTPAKVINAAVSSNFNKMADPILRTYLRSKQNKQGSLLKADPNQPKIKFIVKKKSNENSEQPHDSGQGDSLEIEDDLNLDSLIEELSKHENLERLRLNSDKNSEQNVFILKSVTDSSDKTNTLFLVSDVSDSNQNSDNIGKHSDENRTESFDKASHGISLDRHLTKIQINPAIKPRKTYLKWRNKTTSSNSTSTETTDKVGSTDGKEIENIGVPSSEVIEKDKGLDKDEVNENLDNNEETKSSEKQFPLIRVRPEAALKQKVRTLNHELFQSPNFSSPNSVDFDPPINVIYKPPSAIPAKDYDISRYPPIVLNSHTTKSTGLVKRALPVITKKSFKKLNVKTFNRIQSELQLPGTALNQQASLKLKKNLSLNPMSLSGLEMPSTVKKLRKVRRVDPSACPQSVASHVDIETTLAVEPAIGHRLDEQIDIKDEPLNYTEDDIMMNETSVDSRQPLSEGETTRSASETSIVEHSEVQGIIDNIPEVMDDQIDHPEYVHINKVSYADLAKLREESVAYQKKFNAAGDDGIKGEIKAAGLCQYIGCSSSRHEKEGLKFFYYPPSNSHRFWKWIKNTGNPKILEATASLIQNWAVEIENDPDLYCKCCREKIEFKGKVDSLYKHARTVKHKMLYRHMLNTQVSGVSNCTLLDQIDCNKKRISSWASEIDSEPDTLFCRCCQREINVRRGVAALNQHAKGFQHKKLYYLMYKNESYNLPEVVSNSTLLDQFDSNKKRISTWASEIDGEPNTFLCRCCQREINVTRGVATLNQHAKGYQHKHFYYQMYKNEGDNLPDTSPTNKMGDMIETSETIITKRGPERKRGKRLRLVPVDEEDATPAIKRLRINSGPVFNFSLPEVNKDMSISQISLDFIDFPDDDQDVCVLYTNFSSEGDYINDHDYLISPYLRNKLYLTRNEKNLCLCLLCDDAHDVVDHINHMKKHNSVCDMCQVDFHNVFILNLHVRCHWISCDKCQNKITYFDHKWHEHMHNPDSMVVEDLVDEPKINFLKKANNDQEHRPKDLEKESPFISDKIIFKKLREHLTVPIENRKSLELEVDKSLTKEPTKCRKDKEKSYYKEDIVDDDDEEEACVYDKHTKSFIKPSILKERRLLHRNEIQDAKNQPVTDLNLSEMTDTSTNLEESITKADSVVKEDKTRDLNISISGKDDLAEEKSTKNVGKTKKIRGRWRGPKRRYRISSTERNGSQRIKFKDHIKINQIEDTPLENVESSKPSEATNSIDNNVYLECVDGQKEQHSSEVGNTSKVKEELGTESISGGKTVRSSRSRGSIGLVDGLQDYKRKKRNSSENRIKPPPF